MNLPKRHAGSTAWATMIAVVFFPLLASLAGPSYAQPAPRKKPTAVRQEAWQGELKAWEQRWSALRAQGPKADSAKWSALEADLSALTKKYGQRTEEQMRKMTAGKAGTIGEFSPCPPRDDRPGYCCFLFPGPKGVCRYVCVPCKNKL